MVGSRRVAVGVCIIIVTASLVLGAGVAHGSSSTRVGDDSCSNEIVKDEQERVDARELTELFDAGLGATSGPQLVGMDYQRAFELDDGRVLWVFQDAFVADGDGTELIHAAGAIQTGTCFEPLVGSDRGAPESWIAPDETVPFERWFWPLDGYQVDDATFLLFVAEMRESGEAYLTRAAPVATHTVEVDLATFAVGELTGAPDPSDALYGFSITGDDDYRYFFAQCHRQFGFGPLGHDVCADRVTVARQVHDEPMEPFEYWDGSSWQGDGTAAVDISPTMLPNGVSRGADPMQIRRDGDRWIAVTKIGDWWGHIVVFDVADDPQGPWTTTAVWRTPKIGPTEQRSSIDVGESINSYFVSFVPDDGGDTVLSYSNNRWDGRQSDWYVPRFEEVDGGVWDATGSVACARPNPVACGQGLPRGRTAQPWLLPVALVEHFAPSTPVSDEEESTVPAAWSLVSGSRW